MSSIVSADASDLNAATQPSRRAMMAKVVPVVVSTALVCWLLGRVSLDELAQVVTQDGWQVLAPLTLMLVTALYLWDGICLRWLFSEPNLTLDYRSALYARGMSYLAGAINYWLGQGMLAWMLAKIRRSTLLSALARCFLLTCHDVAVLFALGLVASSVGGDPRAGRLQVICAVGLSVIVALAITLKLIPIRWRNRLRESRCGAWLGSWSLSRSARLCLLRAIYFAVIMVYAGIALYACGVEAPWDVVCRTIPLVLLVESLPISLSGLGPRETALLYLLSPDRPEKVLAFGLIWSAGLLLGRTGIGLGNLWLTRGRFHSCVCPSARNPTTEHNETGEDQRTLDDLDGKSLLGPVPVNNGDARTTRKGASSRTSFRC